MFSSSVLLYFRYISWKSRFRPFLLNVVILNLLVNLIVFKLTCFGVYPILPKRSQTSEFARLGFTWWCFRFVVFWKYKIGGWKWKKKKKKMRKLSAQVPRRYWSLSAGEPKTPRPRCGICVRYQITVCLYLILITITESSCDARLNDSWTEKDKTGTFQFIFCGWLFYFK